MYHQHRGMLPHNAMQNPRLTELLEQIKTEFESQGQRVVADGHERDTFCEYHSWFLYHEGFATSSLSSSRKPPMSINAADDSLASCATRDYIVLFV